MRNHISGSFKPSCCFTLLTGGICSQAAEICGRFCRDGHLRGEGAHSGRSQCPEQIKTWIAMDCYFQLFVRRLGLSGLLHECHLKCDLTFIKVCYVGGYYNTPIKRCHRIHATLFKLCSLLRICKLSDQTNNVCLVDKTRDPIHRDQNIININFFGMYRPVSKQPPKTPQKHHSNTIATC